MEEQTQVFDSVDIERTRNSDGESEIVFGPRQAAGKIQERRKSPQTRTAGTHTLTQREERDLTSSQRMRFFCNVWLAVSAPRQPRRKNLNRRRRVTRFFFVRSLSYLSPERVFLGFFFLRQRAAFNSIAFAEFPLC